MKKMPFSSTGKKLELNKTAVAKLNLTPAEMQAIVGGRLVPNTPDTDQTSKAIDETQCTGQTHKTGNDLLTTLL